MANVTISLQGYNEEIGLGTLPRLLLLRTGICRNLFAHARLMGYTLPSTDRCRFASQATPRARAMTTSTKKDLINRIAESTATRQVLVRTVAQQFFDEIIAELANGNRLEFRDFGVFETKTTPARMAQNPKTLEKVEVPAKRRVLFKPGRLMKERVNGTFEQTVPLRTRVESAGASGDK